jgi:RimJ/RimL family protein N-acetyltransferase
MEIKGTKVKLREKKFEDAPDDYTWHRDPELAHLDGISPTRLTFEQYQSTYARELRHFKTATRHVFAIETLEGVHIGNCAYYGIDEDAGETELGVLMGNREYWDRGYGADAVNLLVNQVFQKTKLKRIYLKTLEENRRAQVCFKKCGFVPYVTMMIDGSSYVFMEITRSSWKKRQEEREAKNQK